MNCLLFALYEWDNRRCDKILYNGDHVICYRDINKTYYDLNKYHTIETIKEDKYIGIHNYGIDHFKSSFKDILSQDETWIKILEKYFEKDNKEKEAVNNPSHYGGKDNVYEAIKVVEAWELGFHLGNTVKYISRAGKKNKDKELEDLRKAKWYLERHIDNLERKLK